MKIMKNRIKIIFTFLMAVFFVLDVVGAQAQMAEKIDDYAVEVKINRDATIDIIETIQYDFGANQKHGIFRNIPFKYKARGGNFKLRLLNFSVKDENGMAYNFTKTKSGNETVVKIGDVDKFVSGRKTYVIGYTVDRAINYFDNFDELYWNGIGTEWNVAIENSSIKVFLPESISDSDLQISCYVGSGGSTEKCLDFENRGEGEIYFTSRRLNPLEGFTFAVGFPKGIVREPSVGEKILETVKDNWVAAVPFLVFFILLYLWWTRGRDPKGRETIIAQYDAPDNFTPIEVGIIINERSDAKDVSAQIIHLAIKGYLKIEQIENKILIFSSRDYKLEKLKEVDDNLKDFEKKIMYGLFRKGNVANISDLKNKFYKDVKKANDDAYKNLVVAGYFVKNPNTVRTFYSVIGGIALFLGFFVPTFLQDGFFAAAFTISGIMIILFGIAMPRKTKKGVLAREHILGLKEYLSVAEKDRINFHNAPEKTPEHFEKLLPFAMVLGVEKEWAKQFEEIYRQNPSWYAGPVGTSFSPSAFASDMKSFSAATAASGGSGSSGGGSSGGGGGGGGGGSW